jgi:hypothetical protein
LKKGLKSSKGWLLFLAALAADTGLVVVVVVAAAVVAVVLLTAFFNQLPTVVLSFLLVKPSVNPSKKDL